MSVVARCRLALRRHARLHRTLKRLRHAIALSCNWLLRTLIPASILFGPPKGWFRLADQVRAGRRRGRIVLEEQPPPHPRERSLRERAGMGQERHFKTPIFWSYHANARLAKSTLLLHDEWRRVPVEYAASAEALLDDPGFREIKYGHPVHLRGNWTSVVWRWSYGYYHWLYDALPRLSVLAELPSDIHVIVPAKLDRYQVETLEWLGLAGRYRPTAENHLFIEHFYFASATQNTGCYDPFALQFLRRAFLARQDTGYLGPRRFFVQRRTRRLSNDTEVVQMLRRQGWEVVDTENIPLAQQIRLFAQAEAICAIHGAGLANLAWCSPGCRVLELVSTTYLNGVYEGIAEAAGLDYSYLLCDGDENFGARADLKALESALDRMHDLR